MSDLRVKVRVGLHDLEPYERAAYRTMRRVGFSRRDANLTVFGMVTARMGIIDLRLLGITTAGEAA